jgi:endonuclease-3
MVNKVTEKLFKKYKTLDDYCNVELDEFKKDIRSIGLYNSKAKNILETCKKIKNNYNGEVPDSMSELIKLNGVGRKTANIILSTIYNKTEGIAVDTHMLRLNYSLGLISNRYDAIKGEKELMKILDKKLWNKYTYLIIKHGRECCRAGKVGNEKCILRDLYIYKNI